MTLAAVFGCFWTQTAASRATLDRPGRHEVVHGWPILPDGQILGQATGVGVDSENHVFVFHRAGREWSYPFPAEAIPYATVSVFDGNTGRLVRSWGEGQFIMPHGLTLDPEDNVWLTDVGRHQIFKFTRDGRLLMTLGERGVAGSDRSHFNLPTDVAVLPDGSSYVSDGYANTRVVKFGPDGQYLFEWGRPGTGPGEFDTPHSVAVDHEGRVYVADRGNARVQVFDGDGRFLREWKDDRLGRPYAVAIAKDGTAYVVDGGDQPKAPPDRSGAVHIDQEGRVLDAFGRFGNYDGQFRLAHDVAVGEDGAVYVVDAWGHRVQKFVRRR